MPKWSELFEPYKWNETEQETKPAQDTEDDSSSEAPTVPGGGGGGGDVAAVAEVQGPPQNHPPKCDGDKVPTEESSVTPPNPDEKSKVAPTNKTNPAAPSKASQVKQVSDPPGTGGSSTTDCDDAETRALIKNCT